LVTEKYCFNLGAKNQIKGIKLISGFEDDYLSASDPDDYV